MIAKNVHPVFSVSQQNAHPLMTSFPIVENHPTFAANFHSIADCKSFYGLEYLYGFHFYINASFTYDMTLSSKFSSDNDLYAIIIMWDIALKYDSSSNTSDMYASSNIVSSMTDTSLIRINCS